MSEEKEESRKTVPGPELVNIVSRWQRDFRRGLLQLMVLMIIRLYTEEAHGYGLIKVIREAGVQIKAGTVYPLLKRMEVDGLIESFTAGDDPNQKVMTRRVYVILPKGEKMIEEMMTTYYSYNNTITSWYNEIKDSRR
jgi:DNA-binding PadR family transcriptional regulator